MTGEDALYVIGERCQCAHDTAVHHVYWDADERGPCPWVECDDCETAEVTQ